MYAAAPTVVVVNQAPTGPGAWKIGLCEACSVDCAGVCFAMMFPPCAYGKLKQVTGTGDCCGSCCLATIAASFGFYGCVVCGNRSSVRLAFGIPGNGCEDWCVHMWCDPCAMVQEAHQYGKRLL